MLKNTFCVGFKSKKCHKNTYYSLFVWIKHSWFPEDEGSNHWTVHISKDLEGIACNSARPLWTIARQSISNSKQTHNITD